MKKVITKYPIKIGNVLIPKDTVGEVANIEDVKKYFPKISYNPESNFIAVKFLELKPCIVHTSQVIYPS